MGTWQEDTVLRILQPGELRGRKTSSSFCCLIRSGGASIPPWTLWSSRFLSCGAASVEFTSSRYSELWNWTGHFQKETKNFFNAAVADSASEVSMHQRRYTNTRYYYYYYYYYSLGSREPTPLGVQGRPVTISQNKPEAIIKHCAPDAFLFSDPL